MSGRTQARVLIGGPGAASLLGYGLGLPPLFCFAFTGVGRVLGIDRVLEPALRRRAAAGRTWARVVQYAV